MIIGCYSVVIESPIQSLWYCNYYINSITESSPGEPIYPFPQLVHYKDKDAVQAILDILDANPGEITVITLGPLTNIARAAQR
jgi:inosine-uridine nucleoside N-ribohydrolase